MNYKHGHKRKGLQTRTYASWSSMSRRCSPTFKQAADYNARGISVCDRWRTFENFLADMGERPAGMTLERIDNDRGYDPDNCCWATRKEQSRNRRGRRLVTFQGREMLLSEAVELSSCSKERFEQRVYSRGWSVERALATPARRYKKKS